VLLTAADRTARITHQLLTFSRKQVTQPQVVDLRALIHGLRPVLQQLLGTDKQLEITGAEQTRAVTVDPTQVEQVMINLVANARDATETSERVTIDVRNVDLTAADAQHHTFAIAPGAYVQLTVSDTGRGMDASTLAHVFEPFFTTKRLGEGTGLGLSMVYGIVKRHGGYIWAESLPGRGTTMKISWPATPELPGRTPVDAPALPDPRRAARGAAIIRVLVVEDEPGVRGLALRILQEAGYEVTAAEDGRAALRALDGESPAPDLVLTDLLMPRMNGRQLAEALEARYPGLPVIYMSGDTGENIVPRRLVPDGAPFLRKPFTPAQLLKIISAAHSRS
jgi:CheY-like chemotaxis protein